MRERWEEDGKDTATPDPMTQVEQIAVRLHNDKEMDDFLDDVENSNFLDVDDIESNKGKNWHPMTDLYLFLNQDNHQNNHHQVTKQ